MSQNLSPAVMSQRIEAPDSLDFFPTPPWATRAVIELISTKMEPTPLSALTAWDPACGEGDMVRPLLEAFGTVHASDIHHYGGRFPVGAKVGDFLDPGLMPVDVGGGVDWIVTNPPFNHAAAVVRRGLERARRGVAVLVRSTFAEGVGRYAELFAETPPEFELVMSERVIMAKGRLRDPDIAYRIWDPRKGGFVARKPSTASAYVWLVWRKAGRSQFDWPRIECTKLWTGPVRKRLTRPGDYPPLPRDEQLQGDEL